MARSGSKGIPNKNIIKINKKPLIWYSINASLKSNVNETWVSSDSQKILEIANKYNAYTILRPKKFATDNATSESALLHFASKVQFDILIFLQPTSPLIISKDINKAINMLKIYDSVLTVSEINQFVWTNKKPNYDINNRKRRQKKHESFLETGSLFATKKKIPIKK